MLFLVILSSGGRTCFPRDAFAAESNPLRTKLTRRRRKTPLEFISIGDGSGSGRSHQKSALASKVNHYSTAVSAVPGKSDTDHPMRGFETFYKARAREDQFLMRIPIESENRDIIGPNNKIPPAGGTDAGPTIDDLDSGGGGVVENGGNKPSGYVQQLNEKTKNQELNAANEASALMEPVLASPERKRTMKPPPPPPERTPSSRN